MTLHEFNILPREKLIQLLTQCCGSTKWVNKMLEFVPAEDMVELLEDAEEVWWKCNQEDWKQAFAQHPKIGDLSSLEKKYGEVSWAADEQSSVLSSTKDTIKALAEANEEYEKKFGYIFIICATGKSAQEMLTELRIRLQNSPEVEIEIAADEQNKITKLRIEKLLDD